MVILNCILPLLYSVNNTAKVLAIKTVQHLATENVQRETNPKGEPGVLFFDQHGIDR